MPILGYRIGQLGYITDMLTMPEESYEQLAGIDVLVMNALRIASHPTHQNLEEALAVARRIQAKKTYFKCIYDAVRDGNRKPLDAVLDMQVLYLTVTDNCIIIEAGRNL